MRVQILWRNIIAMVLAIIALVLLIQNRTNIAAFLLSMNSIGSGAGEEEQTMGLIAFSLVGLLLVAVVKILTHRDRD